MRSGSGRCAMDCARGGARGVSGDRTRCCTDHPDQQRANVFSVPEVAALSVPVKVSSVHGPLSSRYNAP